MSSNANTSSHVSVMAFIGHTFGRFGQLNTQIFLLPFVHQLMSSMQNQEYVGTWVCWNGTPSMCKLVLLFHVYPSTLALQGCLVLACNT
jgi:hypothetical protein